MRRQGTIKSKPLTPGSPVYLFAPAGAVKEPFKGRGKSLLVEAGYEVICGQSLDESASPFAAGSAEVRLHDWHAALSLGIGALLPARGGYGAVHLLPKAPLAETAAAAPLWIGSSDCTFLQVPLLQEHGLIHFYGPMPCGQLTDETDPGRGRFAQLLAGQYPSELTDDGIQDLNGVTAEGELRGGCLSILAALCGTPWQIDGQDALLVIEDIGEHPYRVERMLHQLRAAGCLNGCRGLLFGTFPGCTDRSGDTTLIVKTLRQFARDAELPAWFGLPAGHGFGAVPIPLGVPARIAGNTLIFLENPLM